MNQPAPLPQGNGFNSQGALPVNFNNMQSNVPANGNNASVAMPSVVIPAMPPSSGRSNVPMTQASSPNSYPLFQAAGTVPLPVAQPTSGNGTMQTLSAPSNR